MCTGVGTSGRWFSDCWSSTTEGDASSRWTLRGQREPLPTRGRPEDSSRGRPSWSSFCWSFQPQGTSHWVSLRCACVFWCCSVASAQVEVWGDKVAESAEMGRVWEWVFPPHWGRGLGKNFCFVISKWHILVKSEVLTLKYVIILGYIPIDVPQPKYWGCAPGISDTDDWWNTLSKMTFLAT